MDIDGRSPRTPSAQVPPRSSQSLHSFSQEAISRNNVKIHSSHHQHQNKTASSWTSSNVIPVFYNLFIPDEASKATIKETIVKEQLAQLLPHHKLLVVAIGAFIENDFFADIPTPSLHAPVILRHYQTGDEYLTLQRLWEYCQTIPTQQAAFDQLVIYLHSKGSFHPSVENTVLRQANTRGALSQACSEQLPTTCNACSHRFSPLPFPHTSGNMWVARCSLLQHMVRPVGFTERVDEIYAGVQNRKCRPLRRYSAEAYMYHHWLVRPCDVNADTDTNYTWNYDAALNAQFAISLQPAPRFDFAQYVKPHCRGQGTDVRHALHVFETVYGLTAPRLDEDWWGWSFYPDARRVGHAYLDMNLSERQALVLP